MPKYTTVQDLSLLMTESTLAELTDDDRAPNTDPTVNVGVAESFLTFAESCAESCLHDWELPFEDTPASFKYAVLVIARYMLHDRRNAETSEHVKESYREMMDWLKSQPEFAEADENLADFVGQDAPQFDRSGGPHIDGTVGFPYRA